MNINNDMKLIDDLFTIKGKKGVFTILLTAAILTIFEMVLFYKVVVPNVENEMANNINKISRSIALNINKLNRSMQTKGPVADMAVSQTTNLVFNDITKGVLKTFSVREKELVDDINKYTVYTGVVLILVLALLLFIIWISVKNDKRLGQLFDNMVEDDDMTDAILSALLTVIPLMAFQILFYFFGKQFKYPGTYGNDELSWVIVDAIDTDDAIKKEVDIMQKKYEY